MKLLNVLNPRNWGKKKSKETHIKQDQVYNDYTTDLETVALEDSSALLSASVVPFNIDEFTTLIDTTKGFDERNALNIVFCTLRDRSSSLYIKMDVMEQLAEGRTATKETLAWWKKQAHTNEDAASVLFPHEDDFTMEESVKTILDHINFWVKPQKGRGATGRVICRGYDFDCTKLESLFASKGEQEPWFHNRRRCSRSMIDAYFDTYKGFTRIKKPESMVPHSALDDAAWDAALLIYGYYQTHGRRKLP